MATNRICSVEGCGKAVTKRDWCEMHYRRWMRHGDATAGRTPNGDPQRFLHEVAFKYEGNDCLKWPFNSDKGYGLIYYEGRIQKVPRLVCEHHRGPPPSPDHESAHSCGNGDEGCCTKRHLLWKTHAGNMADMVEHGTSPRGERHGMVKLTVENVREIRRLKGTMFQRDIAERFGVTAPLISMIHAKKAWAWLE